MVGSGTGCSQAGRAAASSYAVTETTGVRPSAGAATRPASSDRQLSPAACRRPAGSYQDRVSTRDGTHAGELVEPFHSSIASKETNSRTSEIRCSLAGRVRNVNRGSFQ